VDATSRKHREASLDSSGRGGVGQHFISISIERSANRLENKLETIENRVILESQHLDSKFLQIFRTSSISLARKNPLMSGAIKFDNDATFRTIKVDNVRTYAVLPAEFPPIQLGLLQILPEECFCRCEITAKIGTFKGGLPVAVNESASLHETTHTRQMPLWNHPSCDRCAITLPS